MSNDQAAGGAAEFEYDIFISYRSNMVPDKSVAEAL